MLKISISFQLEVSGIHTRSNQRTDYNVTQEVCFLNETTVFRFLRQRNVLEKRRIVQTNSKV